MSNLRNRTPGNTISAKEAFERAAALEAKAKATPPGHARTTILLEASKFRALGEIKEFLLPANADNPAG
jgi:hypothetical protein